MTSSLKLLRVAVVGGLIIGVSIGVACVGSDPNLSGDNNNNGNPDDAGDAASSASDSANTIDGGLTLSFAPVFPAHVDLVQGGSATNVPFTINRLSYAGAIDVSVQNVVGVTGTVTIPRGETKGILPITAAAAAKQGDTSLSILAVPDAPVANVTIGIPTTIRGFPGTPDQSFGASNGKLGELDGVTVTSLTALPLDKVLVATTKPLMGGSADRTLVRYDAKGVKEVDFPGPGGPSNSTVTAAVEPSGNTVACGVFQDTTYPKRWFGDGGAAPYGATTFSAAADQLVARDDAAFFFAFTKLTKKLVDGTLDPAFGSGGSVDFSDRFTVIKAIDPTAVDDVFVGGFGVGAFSNKLSVVGILSDGTPANNTFTSSIYTWTSLLVRSGSLVAGGRAFVAVGRGSANGSGPTSFLVQRIVLTQGTPPPFGQAESIAVSQPWIPLDFDVAPDGSIVVLIDTGSGMHALVRYAADGTADPTLNAKPIDDAGKASLLSISPSGKIFLAGTDYFVGAYWP